MWVHGGHVLATVGTDRVIVVDGQLLVGVDGHKHDTCRAQGGLVQGGLEQGGLVQFILSKLLTGIALDRRTTMG